MPNPKGINQYSKRSGRRAAQEKVAKATAAVAKSGTSVTFGGGVGRTFGNATGGKTWVRTGSGMRRASTSNLRKR